ncbi:MAG: hypothetical protein JO053_15495 [Acidobacteria bacterium]|nr:hypothetical protein [Acidobacteriota bacterium]
MNRIKNIISIAAFSLLVMGLPAIASAQYGNGYPGGYGGYGNGGYNGGYGNGGYGNGGYGNYGGYNDTRMIVRDLKSRTRQLKDEIDRSYNNRGRYGNGGGILADIFGGGWGNNNGRYNNDLRDQVRRFKSAVDRLDNDGRGNSNELRRVLDEGADMDRAMSRNGGYNNGRYGNGGYSIQSQWQAIRQDLRQLSYSYSNNNGRGNGRGNWPF